MSQPASELLTRLDRLCPVMERQIRDGRRLLHELDQDPLWLGRPNTFQMTEGSLSVEEVEDWFESLRTNLDRLTVSVETARDAREMLPTTTGGLPEYVLAPLETVVKDGEIITENFDQLYIVLVGFVNQLKKAQGQPLISEFSSELN